MIEKVLELEKGLIAQLTALTEKIKSAEISLMTTKEGYLKVQGAIEILNILKDNLEPANKSNPDLNTSPE